MTIRRIHSGRSAAIADPARPQALALKSILTVLVFTALPMIAWAVQVSSTEAAATVLNATGNTTTIPQWRPNPVDFFRDLLVRTPGEREQMLAAKPEVQRRRLLKKVQEYEAMSLQDRELRLQATRLRWQLLTILQQDPVNRAQLLAALPENERQQLENRLKQWDALPPAMQKALLDGPMAAAGQLPLLARPSEQTSNASFQGVSTRSPEGDLARWQSTPAGQRHKILEQFQHFFELTPSEKEKTLAVLEQSQRQQVEQTIRAWQALPAAERAKHVTSLKKFAELPQQEQDRYRKMAQEWNQLPPDRREAVLYFADQRPPVPPGMLAPQLPTFMPNPAATSIPPSLPGTPSSTHATNP
jgi:hypothetical protein